MTAVRRPSVHPAVIAAATLVCLASAWARPAAAAEPVVRVRDASARPGRTVVVELEGFSGTAATLMVCGNLALRGSEDCDVSRAVGVGFARSGTTATDLLVTVPPVPCPCVVRASGVSGTEVRTTALGIEGAPNAPTVAPVTAGGAVQIATRLRPAAVSVGDRLRGWLGGRSRRSVEVTLRNTTAGPVARLSLGAAFGRAGELRPVRVPPVDVLGPGESRTYRLRADAPAPASGRYLWEVDVYGPGTAEQQHLQTRVVPWGLALAVVVLMVDLAAFAALRVRRRLDDARLEAAATAL